MKHNKRTIALTGMLVILLPVVAAAGTELLSVRQEVQAMRREVAAQAPNWDALIERVASSQSARADFADYEEAYAALMAARESLQETSAKLSTALSGLIDYRTQHPDMPPQDREEVSSLIDLIDGVSLAVDSYLLRISAIEVTQSILMGGAPEAERVQPEWSASGELGVVTGSGTFTDQDRQFFSLRDQLRNSNNEVYTLSLDYDNDHSFVNLRRWRVGLREELPDFYGGDLNMRQVFTDYRDMDSAFNSRKQLDLRLDYDFPFNQDRTEAALSYAYTSKDYRMLSPRSLLSHRVRLGLTHQFDQRWIGDAYWRMHDYHYALSDALGFNATYLGGGVQYLPSDTWSWQFDYESLEKSYDVRKSSAYFEQRVKLGGRFQPDMQTFAEADYRYLDHNQRRTGALGYDEDRIRLRYYHSFNPTTDGDFRIEWRDKNHQVASGNDYDFWHSQIYLNYYPDYRLRWYFNSDYFAYGYSNTARSYRRWFNRLGLNYNFPQGATMTTEVGYTDQSYSTNSGRDYTIVDLLSDVYFPLDERRDLRFFLAYSDLDQAMPASINDYRSLNWGLEYRCRLNENFRLTLSYTYDRRDYSRQADIKDEALEARLGFEF